MLAPDAWVPLAEVARPHGVRGELRLRPYNRDSELLYELEHVLVRAKTDQVLAVEAVREVPDAILMKLATVDDRDRAIELRGGAVCARRAAFAPLEPGEFYACDVEGARVVVRGAGDEQDELLGTVTEMRSYPTVDVLVVAPPDGGRPWEVPLVEGVVQEVDATRGLVTLSTREGVERA
jgi:16S rRNA processing protein RimM